MTLQIFDVRIYPSPSRGFDIILRVRGGIVKQGNWPTLESAFNAATKIEGRKPGAPVYVYDRSFSDLLADDMAPAVEGLLKVGRAKQ